MAYTGKQIAASAAYGAIIGGCAGIGVGIYDKRDYLKWLLIGGALGAAAFSAADTTFATINDSGTTGAGRLPAGVGATPLPPSQPLAVAHPR